MNRQNTHELRFAHKVRQALTESTQQMPPERLERLAAARKAALQVQKPERHVMQWNTRAAHASASAGRGRAHVQDEPGLLIRLGLAMALFLFVGISVAGFYQTERSHRIIEIAEIDTAVLADDLPISAYADHGFNAYLKRMN